MSETVPLMGIETEYGIIREDLEDSDPVEESMNLLKRCELKSAYGLWAYSQENSHRDMRGFTVAALAQDEEEDEFCVQDRQRPYTYWEMKSDRVLTNGARFYNDHTHPEYSTPECDKLFSLVAHDLAGERIVAECARLRNRDLGQNVTQVFKNNTDYSGHSYGTHDNYLIARRLPFETYVRGLVPFLITRQLYAGGGKVGYEGKNTPPHTGLQSSQRSDFIETILSIETMTDRPIINTRDEPHASENFRRLHLILGDANMSPYATALKVGSTRLVLMLIGEEKLASPFVLEDPVAEIKLVSRDLTGRAVKLRRVDGGTVTPLEVQEWYLEQAEKHFRRRDEETDWVLREWGRTLDELRHRPENLADRIDWAIKRNLFARFMEQEGIGWDDPWLKSLDLEYHNLDPERGLYRGLEQEGRVVSLYKGEEVEQAVIHPPENTRARLRGRMVDRALDQIRKIHWTEVEFKNGHSLDLSRIITPGDVEQAITSNKERFPWL